MRDPHVDRLSYRIECSPTTSFENQPAVERDTPQFRLCLDDGVATFHMKGHYPTVEDAKNSIAPFLRAWEIDIGLTTRPGEIRFMYDRAGVTDRNPPQAGEAQVIILQGIASSRAFGTGTLRVSRSTYPE